MIREGDNFDYDEWLKEVREEEAQAKQAEVTDPSGELAVAEATKPMGTPDDRHRQNSASAGKTLPEIIVRDLDWFFWVLPKLYGRLGTEARDLARKARAIKIPNPISAERHHAPRHLLSFSTARDFASEDQPN
jgi:hypothetical protein